MNIHSIYKHISPLFRRRRMRRFKEYLVDGSAKRVLDVGGCSNFWEDTPTGLHITLLNLADHDSNVAHLASGEYVRGDGCALLFANGSFDIAFSNSVIEHVGSWERQRLFAQEIRRVGQRIWVQTPAREFFIEPHLIAPFIHWLPRSCQRVAIPWLTPRGWFEHPSPQEVEAFLNEVRLLTFAEMQFLFPDCVILRERLCGFTKSYIAVRRGLPGNEPGHARR